MLKICLEEITLSLKFSWKISRGSADFKTNYIIKIGDDSMFGLGEVAPNIRYGETPSLIMQQFENVKTNFLKSAVGLGHLTVWLNELKLCNSLRFGIESAYIHYYCLKNNLSLHQLLKIDKPFPIATAFSIPILPVDEMIKFYQDFNLQRFKVLKIKINNDGADEIINSISKISGRSLMIDANEAWDNVDDLFKLFEKIKKSHILFFEQPLPSRLADEYKYLYEKSPYEIIADESITNKPDFENLKKMFHGVNMKLMKAGGYINGIDIINRSRQNGLKTMIGCMVESSLGISCAFNLSANINYLDLDSFLYINDEPFNLLIEESGIIQLNNT